MSVSSIEDFDIMSRLGSGSYGVVFKVRRKTDNKVYVIKTVRIVDLSAKEQQTAINEVTILSQLKSQFVVHYFDSFISGESLHLVMEYCNKGDLQGLIKKAIEKERLFLPEDLTWDMALQIILGLHYLHGKKILHRDLKAANVFLMKDQERPGHSFLVKIGDLGVAKLLDTSTAFAQTIVGTPYYLSPELCADQPYRDKSDCWALGVLLYECCTLRHPFEARNQCALIMKIIQTPVRSPASENVSDQLSNLILWLLAKEPGKRCSTRDMLCEKTIRKKLEEHGYDLPSDMVDSVATDRIGNNSSPSPNKSSPVEIRKSRLDNLPPPPPSHLDLSSKGSTRGRGSLVAADDRNGAAPGGLVRGGKVVLRGGQVTSPSPRERGVVGNTDINGKRSGVEKEVGVRGDRVRGSQKVLSDKARQRYQVRPVTSISSPLMARTKSFGSEQLDDTIIGNSADSKIKAPVARRFSCKGDDTRILNGDSKHESSSDVSPETSPTENNKSFDDDDYNSAATLVTKMNPPKKGSDNVFKFNADDKESVRKPRRTLSSSESSNYHASTIRASTSASENDTTINIGRGVSPVHAQSSSRSKGGPSQQQSAAMNSSYASLRALNMEDSEYYKDDFDDSHSGSRHDGDESNSDYDDDELDVYNDSTINLKKGFASNNDERGNLDDALKAPTQSMGSPSKGRSVDIFKDRFDSGGTTLENHAFGGEERTLRRSLLLAESLSMDAARVSSIHREKENMSRSCKELEGTGNNKDDDGEDDEDLFTHVLGANCSLTVITARSVVSTAPESPTGPNDASYEDVEETEREIKALERTIDEARSSAISILGLELFSDIYDLCVIGMYSVTEQVQSPAKKEEEERHRVKLYAQLQSIGITALELVSGIKTLIAKESSLNAIKERLKLIHRYK